MGVVRAELLAQGVADLADGGMGGQRLADRDEQIPVTARSLPDAPERALHPGCLPLGPHPLRSLDLAPLVITTEIISQPACAHFASVPPMLNS